MANHTTPLFQVATGPPLENHALCPIESGGLICGVLITPAVEWFTIYTSPHITFCIIVRYPAVEKTKVICDVLSRKITIDVFVEDEDEGTQGEDTA